MPKNQLFRKLPDEEIINKLLLAFGLTSLKDTNNFSRRDLETLGTVIAIEHMKQELEKYYLPCKSRTYLHDLNTKNIVTVLRQFVKTKGYSIQSQEKYSQGDKFIIYGLTDYENKVYKSVVNKPTISTTINFN
jgi:hypothetical protein